MKYSWEVLSASILGFPQTCNSSISYLFLILLSSSFIWMLLKFSYSFLKFPNYSIPSKVFNWLWFKLNSSIFEYMPPTPSITSMSLKLSLITFGWPLLPCLNIARISLNYKRVKLNENSYSAHIEFQI